MQASGGAAMVCPYFPAASQKRQRAEPPGHPGRRGISAAASSGADWVVALREAMEMFLKEHSLAFAMELDRFLESGLTIQAYDQLCREEVTEVMDRYGAAAVQHGSAMEEQNSSGFQWGSSADDVCLMEANGGRRTRGEAEEVMQIPSDSSDDGEAWKGAHGHSFGLMDK